MTLKTLKDIDDDCDNSGWIEETMLRQEAIKWLTWYIEHNKKYYTNWRCVFEDFFNLTDEDLK